MNRVNKLLSQIATNHCNTSTDPKVAVIMGAGNGLGGSIAKKFASEGFTVIVARRTKEKTKDLVDEINAMEKGKCYGFGVDTRRENKVIGFTANIERKYGPIEFAVYNPGANVRFSIADTTSRVYLKVWEMACFGGFLFGKEVSKYMQKRGRGCIIFTGATASIRGNTGFAAFSSAKHGLRALAQSMAKELGPQGIHIAHVVIDGGIDSDFIRNMWRQRNIKLDKEDMLLQPDEIANNYWHLYKQKRNAWTFEMDLRCVLENMISSSFALMIGWFFRAHLLTDRIVRNGPDQRILISDHAPLLFGKGVMSLRASCFYCGQSKPTLASASLIAKGSVSQ